MIIPCPTCQKKLSIPDAAEGKTVLCPHCKAKFAAVRPVESVAPIPVELVAPKPAAPSAPMPPVVVVPPPIPVTVVPDEPKKAPRPVKATSSDPAFRVNRYAQRQETVLFALGGALFFLFGVGISLALLASDNPPLSPYILAAAVILIGLVEFVVAFLTHAWPRMFPRTLQVIDGKLQLRSGDNVDGEIALGDVEAIRVMRGPVPTAHGASGGLDSAMALWHASKRYQRGIGLSIVLRRARDEKSYWPPGMMPKKHEVEIKYAWDKTYQEIYNALIVFVPDAAESSDADEAAAPSHRERRVRADRDAPPAAEKDPFDFN